MDDEILTLQEAASIMKVHENTVYLWIKHDKLPAFRLGRHWRIYRSELNKWMARR